MTCSLRTHTKVIAIVSLIITGISIIFNISEEVQENDAPYYSHKSIGRRFGGNSLAVEIIIHLYCVLSEVFCLVGAQENQKYYLVPFIVEMCLRTLGCGIVAIYLITLMPNIEDSVSPFLMVLLIYILIVFGLSIYFLTIVVKFFQEKNTETREGIATWRRTYEHPNSPQQMNQNTGLLNVELPPESPNQSSRYPTHPPAYEKQGYLEHKNEMEKDLRGVPI